MKKKLFGVVLSLAMVVALAAGCAPKTEEPAVTENQAVETTATEESTEAATEESTEATAEEATVAPVEKTKVFVTAEWVKSVMDGEQAESADYVIIEGAWGKASDDKAYLEAHIPGAVHLNTDDIEEPDYWNIRTGEEVEKVMAAYGITKDTTVIVYGGDSGATRVAFVCLWAGVENVKVLDGGLDAWKNAGFETVAGEEAPVATDKAFGVAVPAHPEYVVAMPKDAMEAMAANDKFRLVSIRTKDEFEGKTSGYSYIERAGEPEGAVWGHDEFDYRNEDGSFVDFDKAVAMWNEQGLTKDNELAFYCGTGWRATIPWLMAYENGWDNVKLFDGGWFAWQMDENNPVQSITPEEAAAKYNK